MRSLAIVILLIVSTAQVLAEEAAERRNKETNSVISIGMPFADAERKLKEAGAEVAGLQILGGGPFFTNHAYGFADGALLIVSESKENRKILGLSLNRRPDRTAGKTLGTWQRVRSVTLKRQNAQRPSGGDSSTRAGADLGTPQK